MRQFLVRNDLLPRQVRDKQIRQGNAEKTEAFLQDSPLAAIEMTSKAAEAVLPGQLVAAVPSVVLALLFVSFAGAQTQNSHRDLDRNSRVLPRQAQDKL